ncbi:MAG: DUF554 domain-containing protein [Lachnospiraceae bacterium]|nr:DUF554 domain-containing protein [Lachnospiraceae bacterium]
MFGFGTILNVVLIVVGGIAGIFTGRILTESLKDTLMKTSGVCVMFIGIAGTLSKMLVITADGGISTRGTMLMIVSIAIGTVIGEFCRIEDGMEYFGVWLKQKTGNAKDKKFVDAFVTATLTVCIGAMAVVGSIQDGIMGDYSILAAKAVLDLIIIMMMAASMGKGCAFSAIPVGIFQGTITVIAHFAGANVTDLTLDTLSFVGNILIFCVGVNLVWGKKIKVGSMLPALIVAVLMAKFGYFR